MSLIERARAWSGLLRKRRVVVDGVVLTILPGVLDPVLFRSGAWLARQVAQRVPAGASVLDLGCGSGVVGLLAQQAGARVIATDIDPRAVRTAQRNGLSDVRQGDLFAPVTGLRFDWVCFNPPYFPGRPRGGYGTALHGGPALEVIQRFSAALPAHLTPGGVGLVVLSDRAPDAPAALGDGWRLLCEAPAADEVLSLWRLAPGSRR